MNIKLCLMALMILLTTMGCHSVNKQQVDNDSPSSSGAYLLVYFKDSTHSIHMALSYDGYSFTALNDGNALIKGEDIALQKGIRDPHILRGPDNRFYMSMTDLHIFGQREGFRDTEWERQGYGWGNNRGFVLMVSDDLINWSHTNLRVDQAFPGLEDIGAAWAPQTIFDEQQNKLMLYFTMRFRDGVNRMYYSYMNDDFTQMESYPELIFEYPKDVTYIDADITKVDDQFHMFYTPHDPVPGIKQAVSKHINRDYQYDPRWVDNEPQACEAPNLWRRQGTDTWVLMVDNYGIEKHNFGFYETTDFETFTDIGHFNEGVMKATNFSSPKHGTVVHLTQEEARKLETHWNNQ